MSPRERRAAGALAGIYALRMLGLFMILPIFSLYADVLPGATPFLIGVAIGIYGLTQAAFQIPFGLASDRIGRKPVIVVGLLLFAAGSVVAAVADDIWWIIAGRALQGSGAIAAAIMALNADLTREENRLKAMAMIGMSIGLAFAAALVLGPLLDTFIGLSGIFWLTAVLALGAVAVVLWVVPTPVVSRRHRDAEPVPGQFRAVLTHPQLLRLDAGIFLLHLVLTATFVAVPLALRDEAGLPSVHHWWVYLPVLLIGMGAMVPFVVMAEKRRKMKQVFVGAVAALGVAELILAFGHAHLATLVGALMIYFVAFNILEATLPSLVAKISPPDMKGTAMGVYSSAQFLGAFLGGMAGGAVLQQAGIGGVFLFAAAMVGVWLVLAATMENPRYLVSQVIAVGDVSRAEAADLASRLLAIPGVAEAVVIPEDGVAYLKVDAEALDQEALERMRQKLAWRAGGAETASGSG